MPTKKTKLVCREDFRPCGHGNGGAIYGLGFIGAAIYYVTTSASVWEAIVGLLKAVVWPAILVYGSLKTLGI